MPIQNVNFINPEPITVKGIKTYNPKLLRIYTNQADEPYAFDPVAKKTQGSALGAIYKKHHQLDLDKKWMGKVGNPKELQNDPNSTKTRSKKGINLDVIYEKLASDLFQELGRGTITVPKTHLAYLPLFNDFTNNQWLARVYEEDLQMDSSLRIMSYYLDGYENLRTTHTLDEGEKISFLDYLKKHHRPPEQILSPEDELVPLEGMIPLLVIGRCLAEVDLLGGSGRNAGFQWIYDHEGHVQKAQIVKIDPGYAFVFTHDPERPEEPCENALINTHLKLGSFRYYLDDYRDIQTSTNNFDTLVKWEALTPSQQDQFLAVLLNTSRYIQSENLLSFLFNRDGAFFHSDIAQLPQEHAQKTRSEMRDWLNWQLEIYNEPLQNFLERHPEQLLRIRYIDDLGELPLPMSEKSLPIRELFSELALVIPEEERHKEIDRFKMLESKTKTIQLDQLFSKETKKVVITGESGTGKSTLCQKIAHDWASGKLFSDKFDAVFWIPLRKLNKNVPNESVVKGLANYVATQILNKAELKSPLIKLVQEGKVLFVLDGFDEASNEVKSFLNPLFEEERFYLLLTARPEIDELPDWSHVKNTGFSSAHIEHYIEQFFGEKNPSFFNKLRSDPSLSALAKNPFQLQILCHLEKKGLNSDSRTHLYETMIRQILIWESERRGGQTNEELLFPIGKAAYLAWEAGESLAKGHFQEALKETPYTLEDCMQTGLIKGYEFAHTSIEEYLIAQYLSSVSDAELEDFLSSAHKQQKSHNILRFLCGNLYSKNPENAQKFFDFFLVKEKNLHSALACLNECKSFIADLPELQTFLKNPSNLRSAIEYLVENEYMGAIRWLYEKKPKALEIFRDKHGFTFLMLAAYHGSIQALDWSEKNLEGQLEKKSIGGQTPMFAASQGGHVQALYWLHERDPSLIQERFSRGRTPMYVAAFEGHIEATQWLYEKDPSLIQKTTIERRTPMHAAAFSGQLPVMQWIQKIKPSHIKRFDDSGRTPMHDAVFSGHLEAMQWLHEIDPSLVLQKTKYDTSCMEDAAYFGYVEVMQWLYQINPSLIQKTMTDGFTLMHLAVRNGHVQAMQWLHEKDPLLIQKTDKYGSTPMHDAASEGHVQAMQWLHEKDPLLIQKTNKYGSTPIDEAADGGHVQAMLWLYDTYPSLIQKAYKNDRTPLRAGNEKGQTKAVEPLEFINSFQLKMPYGWPALHQAAFKGCVGTMQRLHDIDPSLVQKTAIKGKTPMHAAALGGHVKAMEWLFDMDHSLIQKTDADGWTPMHTSAREGQIEAMQWLHDIDPSLVQQANYQGYTPMHLAIEEGKVEAILWLYDINPYLIQQTFGQGSTIMHLAAYKGQIGTMQFLHEIAPSPIQKTATDGRTPMHLATQNGHVQAMEWLYDMDPSLIQKTDRNGWIPMHVAAFFGNVEAIEWLHEKTPSLLQETTHDGITPMHMAAQEGHFNMIKWLFEKDPNLLKKKNFYKRTPLDFAIKTHNTEIISFILNKTGENRSFSWFRKKGNNDDISGFRI